MIAHVITDTSITFYARFDSWNLSDDHPHFTAVRDLLVAGSDDADRLIHLCDVREGVKDATDGRAILSEEGVTFDGQALDAAWANVAVSNPEALKVLVVQKGNRVRIENDEDAPDGIYIVGAIDEKDVAKRIFVEDEAGVGFFGYVPNESIAEILRD